MEMLLLLIIPKKFTLDIIVQFYVQNNKFQVSCLSYSYSSDMTSAFTLFYKTLWIYRRQNKWTGRLEQSTQTTVYG